MCWSMPDFRAASCCAAWPLPAKILRRLNAILITHEHLDHVAGLAVLARKLRIPVFFTETTHPGVGEDADSREPR